jgi:Tfp pilus assembly protein PilF
MGRRPLQRLTDAQLALAEAGEQLPEPLLVARAMTALAQLDPVDPAAIDFRMAKALVQLSQLELAKHHVLRALSEAPRYRDAHRLLLEIAQSQETKSP